MNLGESVWKSIYAFIIQHLMKYEEKGRPFYEKQIFFMFMK